MTRLTSNANEKTQDDPGFDLAAIMENLTSAASSPMPKPMVITAVQRKVNIGNFETIDVYVATVLPVDVGNMLDQESLQAALTATVDFGIAFASKETGDRYKLIKDAIV